MSGSLWLMLALSALAVAVPVVGVLRDWPGWVVFALLAVILLAVAQTLWIGEAL